MFKLFFQKLRVYPTFLLYCFYDWLIYRHYRKNDLFYGWGIHLFTGRFGAGKTSLMVIKAYELCKKYPQLHILTNLKLTNFPVYTNIMHLSCVDDILQAPENTLVLIDEIGTIFNSRDFMSGKKSVPKALFQHLAQCRHRKMMILGTVQRFLLLDKQIRDISATVTECRSSFKHPFSRMLSGVVYDIDEYEDATDYFEFMANNTDVEWAQYGLESMSGTQYNYVTTSHEIYSEVMSSKELQKQIYNKDCILNYHIHSHPFDFYATAKQNHDGSVQDIMFKNSIQKRTNGGVEFYTYSRFKYNPY